MELEKKLQSDELKQLNQRITIRYRLKPLSKKDAIAYIYHRIRIAGGGELIRFTPMVLERIYRSSKGVPRLINMICERALMAAYAERKNTIEKVQIKKAVDSIVGEEELKPAAKPLIRPVPVMIMILLLIIAAAGLRYWFFPFSQEKAPVIYAIPESEKAALAEKEANIKEKEVTLLQKEAVVSKKDSEIDKKEEMIEEKEEELSEKELALRKKEEALKNPFLQERLLCHTLCHKECLYCRLVLLQLKPLL